MSYTDAHLPASLTTTREPLLLAGDGGALALAHDLLARQGLQGTAPWIVDCGGVFDPYAVALHARRLGAQPEPVLRRLQVCRVFTAYQQLHALRRLVHLSAGAWVYLLDPLSVLLDADLPHADRDWLFGRLLAGLSYLSGRGDVLRLCQPWPPAGGLSAGQRFRQALLGRYRLVEVRADQLESGHGQVRVALQPRNRPAGGAVRPLPARVA